MAADSDSDADIGAMKAKFNQLLSNFEQASNTGTAYFASQHDKNRAEDCDGRTGESFHSDQENTGALNINLGQQMFSKPPKPQPARDGSGTPDRGQHYYKRAPQPPKPPTQIPQT